MATDNYTTFASDFGKQTEHWNGVDVSVNARLQNGVMLQGGVSTGPHHHRQLRGGGQGGHDDGRLRPGASSTTRRSSTATTSATS